MSKKREAKKVVDNVPAELDGTNRAKLVLMPQVSAASVILAYPGNIVGSDVDLGAVIDGLRESCSKVKDGDLCHLESMLVAQATALQAMFTSLARRAQMQEYVRNLETFLTLALKAQAQSRATIQALAELKYPRQVAFVKQANISHGPQQVNNTGVPVTSCSRARKKQAEQNKLLEDKTNGRTYLDRRATATTGRSDAAMETVGKVDRAEKCER
jgi:hypothetical protein